MNALIADARFHFHERLFETNTLTLTKAGVASNAGTSTLYELVRAVKEVGSEDASETLETLVHGKRLKDISDLPLDLAV